MSQINIALVIFAAGGLGALGRYAILLLANQHFLWWPWGTLLVNMLGTLLFGVAYYLCKLAPWAQTVLLIGFLGSLTTFSTFAFDAWLLISQKKHITALLFILAHVSLGLIILAIFNYLQQHHA